MQKKISVYEEFADLWDMEGNFPEVEGKPFTVQYLETSRQKKYRNAFSGKEWCDAQRDYVKRLAKENGWHNYHISEKGKEMTYMPGRTKNRKR
jgi:hypothetical protein